jgi:F-box protein 21
VQWKRSDASREEIRKATTRGDWWLMYAARCRIDRRALDLLDTIIARRDGREFLAVELTKDLGYDAWEAVSQRTSRVRRRAIMDKDTRDMIDVPTEDLTRQYWGHEILGVISRVRAIDIWKPLTDPFERGVSFEQGLAALSAFFGEDIHKVNHLFLQLSLSLLYLFALDTRGI